MKIIEITRGHIKVKVADKTSTIQGEGLLLINDNNISYVVYSNSIKNWDEPFDKIEITQRHTSEMISLIINDFENRGQKIVVE